MTILDYIKLHGLGPNAFAPSPEDTLAQMGAYPGTGGGIPSIDASLPGDGGGYDSAPTGSVSPALDAPGMAMGQPQNASQRIPAQPQGIWDHIKAAFNNPAAPQILLAMGAKLAEAGNASRLPVSTGAALGSAADAGMQAYQGYQAQQENKAYKDAQIQALLHPKQTGETWAPMTPADKKKYGVSPTDPNSWLVSSSGDVKIAGGSGYGSNPADVEQAKAIAGAIITGDQPPDMHGLYRYAGPVKAELAKQGYDLTKANQDWTATQKLLSTLNGAQQVRLRQAVNQVSETLPLLKDLASQWKGGKFPALNKVNIAAAKQGAFGQDAQSLATRLDAEIADATAELGTVYMGGNTPTDHALQLAAKQFQSNWSEKTFMDAIDLANTNLNYRKNSMSLTTGGIPASQYNPTQQSGNAPTAAPAASGAAPAASGGWSITPVP